MNVYTNNGARYQPSINKKWLKLSTLSLSIMCASLSSYAVDSTDAEDDKEAKTIKVKKVTVTGSSIKGVAAQSASPITIIKVSELTEQGITTTEEALAQVSANQIGFSTAQNVGTSNTAGSTANLRGLGSDKTLVLLNGRRVANSAFYPSATNLNIIPLSLIDRIEVLRDGASATYGADAIGGVINFITKKSYNGFGISGDLLQPEQAGGDQQHISIFGGYGNLEEQGFNIFGAVDYKHSNDVMAQDRNISRRGGLIPELGMSSSSSGSFPANIIQPSTGLVANPYGNANCNNEPYAVAKNGLCYYNYAARVGIVPKTENVSVFGRGTFKLTDSFNAIAEYLYSRDDITTSVAPDVYLGTVTMPSTSPYYPGKGITPDISGLNDETLQLRLRSQAGNRISQSINESHRAFAGIEGEALGWDINSGITYAYSNARDIFAGGYLNQSQVQAALNDGSLNPFGNSSLWKSFEVKGTAQKANLSATTFDVTASRKIFTLPAGDVGFALGGSLSKQEWQSKANTELVSLVPSSGIDPTKPTSKGSRDIRAVYTELHVPITQTIEAQFAGRYDDYSDFGSTFNPKFALRWEPIKQLMLRTTYSTGFRAPSLYDFHAAQIKTNTGTFNDPVLCPGGVAISDNYRTECNTQFLRLQGGSSKLEPEKSKSFTAGLVYEPVKNLVFTLDYYNIRVKNLIDALTDSIIFSDPEKYASYIIRDANGKIAYVDTTPTNMGGLKTQGLDVSLNYLSPTTSTGRFGFGIDGSYVFQYDKQEEKDGPWINKLGTYNNPVIVRWKHVANLNWSYQDWKLIFEQTFSRGYKDQNLTGNAAYDKHRVSDYIRYNVSGTYKGFKNLQLTGGIKNLFNTAPPASNVGDNFQLGYDSSYGDPTGRTYFVRGTYTF